MNETAWNSQQSGFSKRPVTTSPNTRLANLPLYIESSKMVRRAPYWYYAYFPVEFTIGAVKEKNKERKRKNKSNPHDRTVSRVEENVERKVCVITGANSGLGKYTATEMAKRGAVVVMGCRNLEKGEQARKEIMDATGSTTVELYKLDLSDPSIVRSFAEQVLQKHSVIDILINNAGISLCQKKQPLTKEGWDISIATNHLGHFLLTNLLISSILPSSIGRVVTVSSTGCITSNMDIDNLVMTKKGKRKLGIWWNDPYQNSKLANALFTKALAKRFPSIKAFSVCPGFVRTEIFSNWTRVPVLWQLFQLMVFVTGFDVEQGADILLLCSLDKRLHNDSGGFFRFGKRVRGIEKMLKDNVADDLWKVSEEYVGLK